MATSQIDAAMCERFVVAASRDCSAAQTTVAVPPPAPEWDALANSFAALGLALALGGVLLTAIALLGGFAWAKLVRREAEREAREEARACVEKIMDEWKANQAPQIVRKHVEFLLDASIGAADDESAADDMGKGAG